MNQFLQTPFMLTTSANEAVLTSLIFNVMGGMDFYSSCSSRVDQDTFKISDDILDSKSLPISQPKPNFYYNFCLPSKNQNDKLLSSTEFETYVHLLDHTGVVFDFNINFSHDCPSFSMTDHHLFIHPKYKQAAYSYEVLFLYDTTLIEKCGLVETPFSEIMLNTKDVVVTMNAPYTFLKFNSNHSDYLDTRTLTYSLYSSLLHLVSTSKKSAHSTVSIFCQSEFDRSLSSWIRTYLNQLTQVNTTSDRFRVSFTTALSLSLVAKPLYTLLLENNKANILITQRP